MDTASGRRNDFGTMKLRVRNFGPIRKADVELKPLTVFVGPSNTGKSYLAILLYSIAKALRDEDERTLFFFRQTLRGLLRKRRETVPGDNSPKEIARKSLSFYGEAIVRSWQDEAAHCFGEEWRHIAPKNNGAACDIEIESQSRDAILELTAPGESKLPPAKPLLGRVGKVLEFAADKDGAESRMAYTYAFSRRIAPHIAETFGFLPKQDTPRRRLRPNMRGIVSESVHYLPAARGGIIENHRTLVGSLIKGVSGIRERAVISFTGVMGDFLTKLVNIRDSRALSAREQSYAFSELADAIESKVIKGKIQAVVSATKYPDFRYRFVGNNKREMDISLANASSSVSELAPIVLFMRHYLSPGDIFIVEEPEAHLHPAAQREVAGVLAALANAGVYVVITTHSDVILEQLSNFIHADGVPDAKVLNKKIAGRAIKEENTAVYSFAPGKPGGRGTTVRKVEFDGDTGILTKDHLDESSALYNEHVDIFNRKQRNGGNNDN